jgi:mannitol operon transcriptional antiterminator
VAEQTVEWLQSLTIWPVASFVAQRLSKDSNSIWKPGDIAGIAMEMMAAHRAEIMPGEIEPGEDFPSLIDRLMEYISEAFGISKLKHDHTLQNGLRNYIVPACFRQQFNLWYPESLSKTTLPEQYERENDIAQGLSQMVQEHTSIKLPQAEINNLVVLLRAAFIRNRTYRFEHIMVVCPSGMATAQLLVARLNARFPYLNPLGISHAAQPQPGYVHRLILTTVPLQGNLPTT